ncbi:SagB/ThcOx family dehydrogenase [bacterium]|nr:SagB/ThcOx family dehydrogenase [bacterium]
MVLPHFMKFMVAAYGQGPGSATTLAFEPVQLPEPDVEQTLSLLEALKNRKSDRDFSPTDLTLNQLSTVLWCANGLNREDGRRTAPAALNMQAVDLYLVLPAGIFGYEPAGHRLLPIRSGDQRALAGMQDFVAVASLNLVYVADLDKLANLPEFVRNVPEEIKLGWTLVSAGCQCQNVALFCAATHLKCVVRGSIDAPAFSRAVGLKSSQRVLLAQTIG